MTPVVCLPFVVYWQGYALIEFEKREEAEAAIKGMNDKPILGQDVKVDWAIVKGTLTHTLTHSVGGTA